MFKNRQDAGERLAQKLVAAYGGRNDVIVLALPRGGVVLGRIVADRLKAPLDIVVPRKIGAPGNPEYAIGAITETGEAVWNEPERLMAGDAYIAAAVAKEKAEAQRRLEKYRPGRSELDLHDRTALIVDDGIATGLTVRAALQTVRRLGAAKVVIAVPVAAAGTAAELGEVADDLVALMTPDELMSIGAYYSEFSQVTDDQVTALLAGR